MSAQNYIVYFWIAFYSDGSCLPQYDLETGQQHFFKEIDHSRLAKFGWFPFTVELASKVGDFALVRQDIPYHVLEIGKNQRLIALRREYQHFFTYTHCLKCRFNWQWIPKIPLSFKEWIKQNYPQEYEKYKGEFENGE